MNDEKNIEPILMIENEPWEITDLEEAIDGIACRLGTGINIREYNSSAEDGIQEMKGRMERNDSYSAIICDNHLNCDFGDCLDGDEFLQVIVGNVGYALSQRKEDSWIPLSEIKKFEDLLDITGANKKDRVYQFLLDNFDNIKEYNGFVNHFFGEDKRKIPLIMLCGSPRESKLEGLEDRVDLIQKQIQRGSGKRIDLCEKAVIRVLVSEGIFPFEVAEKALDEHPRLSSYANPNNREYSFPKDYRKR